jgi:hypothetical protein
MLLLLCLLLVQAHVCLLCLFVLLLSCCCHYCYCSFNLIKSVTLAQRLLLHQLITLH